MNSAVLLVDNDLGFVFWLGRALDQAGFEAFPAKSISDCVGLIDTLHLTIGLVVVNFSLAGAGAFVERLRMSQRPIKTIAVLSPDASEEVPPGIDAMRRKPAEVSEEEKAEWIQLIRSVMLSRISVPLAT